MTLPQVVNIPPDVLVRYGIRILDPATARRDENGLRPQSTAYRADTLLVPMGDIASLLPGESNVYDEALKDLGVALRPPKDDPSWGRLRPGETGQAVPVPLVAREDTVPYQQPDPWTALVALRGRFGMTGDDRAGRIGLDHLIYSAAVGIQGAPYSGGGAVGDGPGQANGIALYTGSRNPVQFLGPAPYRTPESELRLGRRPVVAVIDTGVGRHPWLPVGDGNPDRVGETLVDGQPLTVLDLSADPVVEVSHDFQEALAAHEASLAMMNGAVIEDPVHSPWEERDVVQPLLGLTDSHSGHGTFVTGLIHQLCPHARVLSLRVLHSDGFSTEGSLLFALRWLRRQIDDGRNVDVVSLSLGFYAETATSAQVGQVAEAIRELTERGVVVLAASGNDATTRPFLPAAFGADNAMLAAIGARNASGVTTAAFCNYGNWISRWAPGNAMVSTVPVWQGAQGAALALLDNGGLGPRWRTAPDPDDLSTGFAVWAGTSFATPVVAGMVAAQLADDHFVESFGDAGWGPKALAEIDKKLVDRGWQDPVPESAAVSG